MPEITPVMPEGSLTIQARTQTPSAQYATQVAQQLRQPSTQSDSPTPGEQPQTTGSEIGEKKATENEPIRDEKELKARLFLEKTKE